MATAYWYLGYRTDSQCFANMKSAIQIIPAAILIAGLKWLPESPRWLISQDRDDQAWAVLSRLRIQPGSSDDLVAKAEFVQIRAQFTLDSQFQSSYMSLLTYAPYRKRLMFGTLWIFFTQCSGALVIVSKSTISSIHIGARRLTLRIRLLACGLWAAGIRCRGAALVFRRLADPELWRKLHLPVHH